jgi:hypothetical protein
MEFEMYLIMHPIDIEGEENNVPQWKMEPCVCVYLLLLSRLGMTESN